ncbi:MAG: hypothetical protein ACYTEZ_07345 [Planctomycetota bacterium]
MAAGVAAFVVWVATRTETAPARAETPRNAMGGPERRASSAPAGWSAAPQRPRDRSRSRATEPTRTDVASTPEPAPTTTPEFLARLRERLAARQALRPAQREVERELRELKQERGDPSPRDELARRQAELEAQAETLDTATRRARSDLHSWLVADAGRPLEMYRLLRQPDQAEGLGRPGRLLAGFFDNRRLEKEILRDLRVSPDEHVRGLALDVVAARPSDARVTAVTSLAQEKKSERVRVKALGVLAGFKDDPLALPRRRQIRAVLVAAAQDETSAPARIRGLTALSREQPNDQLLELFRKTVNNDPDPHVRAVANQALRRWSPD